MNRCLLRLAAGLVVLSLVTAACTSTHHRAALPAVSRPVWVTDRCPATLAQFPQGGSIPAGYQVAEVLECARVTRVVAAKGEWSALQEGRATAGFDAFVAALRRPSQQPPRNASLACTGEGLPSYVVLIDSKGRALTPAWPTDMCGNPQQAAIDALGRVPFRTISTTLLSQVESQLAYTSGCSDGVKDILGWEANRGVASSWPPSTDHHLLLCLYSVNPPAFGDMPGPTGPEVVGRLIGAGTLTGFELATLRTKLVQARPAGDCRTPHSQFALLTGPNPDDGGGPGGYVEMNGCQRWHGPVGGNLSVGAQTIAMLRSVALSN